MSNPPIVLCTCRGKSSDPPNKTCLWCRGRGELPSYKVQSLIEVYGKIEEDRLVPPVEEWTDEISNKCKGLELLPGTIVSWYYKEDYEYSLENDFDSGYEEYEDDEDYGPSTDDIKAVCRLNSNYRGVLIPVAGAGVNGETEPEDTVVVIIKYPAEKVSNYECDYVHFERLLSDPDLVEIFEEEY